MDTYHTWTFSVQYLTCYSILDGTKFEKLALQSNLIEEAYKDLTVICLTFFLPEFRGSIGKNSGLGDLGAAKAKNILSPGMYLLPE